MMPRVCRVCGEAPTRKLPHCDLSPLAVRLPKDVHLCFWCRRDLLNYLGDPDDVSEEQITTWLVKWLKTIAERRAAGLPLRRCEVGNGRDRCSRWAAKERDGLWLCGKHAQPRFVAVPRHYLDWKCQRTTVVDQSVIVLPPKPRQPRPKVERGQFLNKHQKGSANANSRLTEDDVRLIKDMIDQGNFNTTIASHFGVTHSMISAIRRGKAWTHVR